MSNNASDLNGNSSAVEAGFDDEDLPNSVGNVGPIAQNQHRSYASLNNGTADVIGWTSASSEARCSWLKALSVLSVALTINVAILTVYVFIYTEPTGTFSTASDASSIPWAPLPKSHQVLTKLAFGSCDSQHMPQPHWDTLTLYQPDLVVLMGDNVYGDCNETSCKRLSQAYADLAARPSFIGAKSRLPVVATLDDHDYGQSDCHANNPYKETAKQMFLDFFDIHDERRDRDDDGVYYSYKWGAGDRIVQVILLDTRYSRSPFTLSDEPHKKTKEIYMPNEKDNTTQMLSPTQWKWFEDQMKEKAHVRIIVSSIQVMSDAHGFECWRMLPHERTRLQTLILQQKGISTTVLLSGDRHVGGIYETPEGVVEMTASSWTHTMPFGAYDNCDSVATCDEVDANRFGDLIRVNHFGSVEIDWENRNVTLALRMADGTARYRYHQTGDQKTDAGSVLRSRSYAIPTT